MKLLLVLRARRLEYSVPAAFTLILLATAMPQMVSTPQLNGSAALLPATTIGAFMAVACFLPMTRPVAARAEGRSPRPLGWARFLSVLIAALTLIAGSLVAAAFQGGGAFVTIRAAVGLLGLLLLGGHWSTLGGMGILTAYAGLCLFGAVDANGGIAVWAFPLGPERDVLSNLISVILFLLGSCLAMMKPHNMETS